MGLLDFLGKKKEDKYALPAKLEMLLNMVLQKGEVSDKDLAVLRTEAQRHNISEGELDIIIESRLSMNKPQINSETLDSVINSNLYSEQDSVTQIFQKYAQLCELGEKKLERSDREKLLSAQKVFINNIAAPNDKETMLEFLAQAIPYSKNAFSANVAVAKVQNFFSNMKSGFMSVNGGQSSNPERDEIICQSEYKESLANSWYNKLERLFRTAENRYGKDRQFEEELRVLKEQFAPTSDSGY